MAAVAFDVEKWEADLPMTKDMQTTRVNNPNGSWSYKYTPNDPSLNKDSIYSRPYRYLSSEGHVWGPGAVVREAGKVIGVRGSIEGPPLVGETYKITDNSHAAQKEGDTDVGVWQCISKTDKFASLKSEKTGKVLKMGTLPSQQNGYRTGWFDRSGLESYIFSVGTAGGRRSTRRNRKSLNKTLRGGGECDAYIKEKLAAINKARANLNQFYRSWLPADGYNENGENLHLCGDHVSSYINNALHYLNVAEDEYQVKCKQTGGAGPTEIAMERARKKAAAEEAARQAKIWEGRKKRFRDLYKAHVKLLQDAHDTLNKSVNTDNACYKKCKLSKATKAIEDAIKAIDDTMYLVVTSVCNE